LLVPSPRRRIVIGNSTTRAPIASAPSNNSDDWYCGSRNVTAVASSARMARNPNDVSVSFCRVRIDASTAKTRTPTHRSRLSASSAPSRRDPVTKSARSSRIGCSSTSSSSLSYCPSASVVTTYCAPPSAAT
jgi:hypothetical protein